MGNGYIFSYRRDHTRAIGDQLAQRFSKDRIFMDVDSIEPGVPFDQVISDAVGRCDVLLAMIGKRWLDSRDGSSPRMNDPKDFVRIEIAAALSRNIRVIPVLLDGATMPAADALSEPLRPLAWRNAIDVSDSRFASDVAKLADAVGKAIGESGKPGGWGRLGSRRPMLYWLLGTVAAITLASTVGVVMHQPMLAQDGGGSAANAMQCSSMAIRERVFALPAARMPRRALTSSWRTMFPAPASGTGDFA